MKVQQLAGGALFAVVAIGLVSWSLLTTKREQNQQQEKVELEQKLPFLQVTGKIGGEKVGFLSDLEVIRILRERYRLEVKAQKSGSLAMMHTSIEGLDFLWPASRGSAELFRGQALKVEDVMNSPIVVFSCARRCRGPRQARLPAIKRRERCWGGSRPSRSLRRLVTATLSSTCHTLSRQWRPSCHGNRSDSPNSSGQSR